MTADLAARCAIAVMAKAPAAGRCKTRLVPPLTPEQAAAMSAAFLRDVTANVAAAGRDAPIDGWIAYAPHGAEAAFDAVIAPGTRLVLADGTTPNPRAVEGFGRCLLHAARALFAKGYGSVCLLNSDSPNLPTTILGDAARALASSRANIVLGAADDGGYYLLGMSAPYVHLFQEVAWSTERVADQTRDRAAALGLGIVELPVWYDVDNAAALARLAAELVAPKCGPRVPFPAPATAAHMARLGMLEQAPVL